MELLITRRGVSAHMNGRPKMGETEWPVNVCKWVRAALPNPAVWER